MIVYVKLFLTAFFWGGTFIAARTVATNVGPFSAAFLRFLVASIFLLLFTVKFEGKLPPLKKSQFIPVFLLGMTGIFSYNVFFFKGLKILEASRGSLIIATNPVFISLLSAYFFKEKLTPLKLIGITASVFGAIIVISRGEIGGILNGGLGLGELYVFCCVLSWVAYSLMGKAIMADLSPLASVSYSSVVGALALLPAALLEGMIRDMGGYSGFDWISIFYLGFFGTVLGFVWYYEGIKKIGPSKASLFINFVPISAIILAFLILDEKLTVSLFVGAAFVSTGVFLTNLQVSGKKIRS